MTIKELQSKLEGVLYLSRSLNIAASSADIFVNITQSIIDVLRSLEALESQQGQKEEVGKEIV